MKKLILILSVFIFTACSKKGKLIVNEHVNLIITPDLSNRIEDLYSKPVSDIALINTVYKNYYPYIYKLKNRILGQEDLISLIFTNPAIISDFRINLRDFKMDLSDMKPAERITYLTKGNYQNLLVAVDSEIRDVYRQAKENTTGGDIYNYFKNEITSALVKKTRKPKIVGSDTIIDVQRNILVLLTDGYVEAGLYGEKNCNGNKCLYLSKSRVNLFRKEFLASGEDDLKQFFTNAGYGIIPVKNENMEHLEIFVSEMYDRSLNKKTGSQTVSPNDFEIMKLFWEDWLEKSGVQHYKLLDTSNSKEEFLRELTSFIEEV